MTIHRFFVPPEQITATQVRIIGGDAAQIRRVLRMEPGAVIQVFDGSGRQIEARITGLTSSEVLAEPLSESYPRTEAPSPVYLLQALLKGEKQDWVVEKATELGASSILLFPASRSVIQVREERTERKVQRWGRIAKEAAEQCGRVKIPEVRLLPSLTEALQSLKGVRLWMADETLAHPLEDRPSASGSEGSVDFGEIGALPPVLESPSAVGVLIGPEGGWTEDERRHARGLGAQPVSLGPRILRAETAAVTALALLTLTGNAAFLER